MPRSFGGLSYLTNGTAPAALTALPVTIAVRFFPFATASGSTSVCCVSNSGFTNQRLLLNLDVSNRTVRAIHTNDAGTQALATSNTLFGLERWNSAVAVFAGTASRTIYCNGGPGTTNTSSITTTTLNQLEIGRQFGSSSFIGMLADVAYWSVDLTETETRAYHNGVDPLVIRPASLVDVFRLTASKEYGVKGAVVGGFTETGPPAVRQAPTYTPRPYNRKPFGAGFAPTVDLNIIGAQLNLTGAFFDLNQLKSDGNDTQALNRRIVRR